MNIIVIWCNPRHLSVARVISSSCGARVMGRVVASCRRLALLCSSWVAFVETMFLPPLPPLICAIVAALSTSATSDNPSRVPRRGDLRTLRWPFSGSGRSLFRLGPVIMRSALRSPCARSPRLAGCALSARERTVSAGSRRVRMWWPVSPCRARFQQRVWERGLSWALVDRCHGASAGHSVDLVYRRSSQRCPCVIGLPWESIVHGRQAPHRFTADSGNRADLNI